MIFGPLNQAHSLPILAHHQNHGIVGTVAQRCHHFQEAFLIEVSGTVSVVLFPEDLHHVLFCDARRNEVHKGHRSSLLPIHILKAFR
eukprot:Skav228342  [mRNA]  locus=scaffold1898:153536:155814:+ [translate_table: standard]